MSTFRRGITMRLLGAVVAPGLVGLGGCDSPLKDPGLTVHLTVSGRSDLTGGYHNTPEVRRFRCDGYLLEASAVGMYGSGTVEWEGATFTWRSLASGRTLSVERLSAGEVATFWSVPNLPAPASTPLKWYDASSTEPFRLTMEFHYRVGRSRASRPHDLTCAEPPPFPLEATLRVLGPITAADSLDLELTARNTSTRTLPNLHLAVNLSVNRGSYFERVGGGDFLLTDPPAPGETRTWIRRVRRVEYECHNFSIAIGSEGEGRHFPRSCPLPWW